MLKHQAMMNVICCTPKSVLRHPTFVFELNITSSETINPKVDQMLDLTALFHRALRQPQCQPHWSVICDDSFHVVGVCNARVRKKVVGAACMVRVVF